MGHQIRTRPSLLPLLLTGGVAAGAPNWNAQGERWWSHIRFLADDSLEGRETGSRGFDAAADYVAEQFRAAGLQPAGTHGFRQPLDLRVSRLEEADCAMDLVRDGVAERVTFGEDAVIWVNSRTSAQVDAAATFVGYGLTVPELGHDDWAAADVKGKIAVYLTGGPAEMPSAIKAHYQSTKERRKAVRKAGAAGVILLMNPRAEEMPWARTATFRFQAAMELADPVGDAPPPLPLVVRFNLDRAERLFAGSGHTLKEILSANEADRPLPPFPLAVRVRARVAVTRSKARSSNVVGVLPGSDPVLKNEFVALSAHLDHLGIGLPVNGDPIYHGAMDNASGTASLIEVARGIHESGVSPKRSILFVAVTGEEKGLLGSEYFATHSTVSGPIVADLNMDMYNPIFPLTHLEVQGLEESSLGEDISAVAAARGVVVQGDQEPEHVLFIRSDQYSFIQQGVPALTFKFSYVPGTPQEKLFRGWLAERYHSPLDNLTQPVDLVGAAQFNSMLQELALRVANAERRPQWKPESFFRRFVK